MSVGLSTALNSALSGLNVNQQQLAVLSQNIANANTAGYSQETAKQSALYLDGQGAGVNADEVQRQVNQNFINAVQQQSSTVGMTGVLNSYNGQIQTLIGQPGNNNSLDGFISTFFQQLSAVASAQTQNNALQSNVVNSGATLATQIQGTAQGLYNLQLQADGDIKSAVTSINSDLTNLASLNHDVVTATLQGQSLAGLQDQRDGLLSDLSQYLNIQTYNNADGSINVTTGGGTTLLDQTTTFQLSYNAVPSVTTFTAGGTLSALKVYATDSLGNLTGTPTTLISGGVPSAVTSTIASGKLAGLVAMRDQQIPNLLAQLDTLAASVRDQVNAIENSGSSFPGANSLTGQRAVNGQDYSKWSGSVQIAVLTPSNGQSLPVASPYGVTDEPNGMPPLNLDLSSMNTGNGAGNPSTQGIIDAINQYFTPQNKVEVGNLNNIQLVSDSDSLPGLSGQFNFDLNLDNISGSAAKLFVSGVTVTPSSGSSTATVTLPAPNINISNYVTTSGSGKITVNTASSTSGLINGETVYLSGPGTSVDGISAGNLTGTFVISNLTGSSFTITAANNATASVGTTTSPVGTAAVTPPYVTQPAGANSRTTSAGLFNIALGSNTSAGSYTVTLNVAVDDGSGDPAATSQISYVVTNNQASLLNQYYAAQTANGGGTIVAPANSTPLAKAMLVDADGNELPKDSNGNYLNTEDGFLKILATSSNNTIAINSQDSAQKGQPDNTPPVPGSNQGFSQYFGLNNFFKSNNLTTTGDSIAGSAINMAVVQSLQDNPGLISLGVLSQSPQPANPSAAPNYTYMLNPGDNSVVQKLATLGSTSISFPASGGLGATSQTFTGYAGAIIAATSSNASTATTNDTNANTLLTGYQKQAATVSGVNLDTELANTVIYQNAYTASARVITVTSNLFDTLLQAFQ